MRYKIFILIFIVLCSCSSSEYREYSGKSSYSNFNPKLIDRFYTVENTAIFPFNNYTNEKSLQLKLNEMLVNKISSLDLGIYFSSSKILDKLYKEALILQKTLNRNYKINTSKRYGYDFLFNGSINEYRSQMPYLVSLSFEMIYIKTRKKIWAYEITLEGSKLDLREFGIDKLNSPLQLIQISIDKAFDNFYTEIEPAVIETIKMKQKNLKNIVKQADENDAPDLVPENYGKAIQMLKEIEDIKDPLISMKKMKQAEELLLKVIKEAKYKQWLKKYASRK